MKAIQYDRFGRPEVLAYVDLPDPVPAEGELLIETTAIGVNFPDIRERQGVYNQAETRVGGVRLPQVGGLPGLFNAVVLASLGPSCHTCGMK